MRITKEMIAEDEQRWHARDVVTELGYCSTYMRDRKDITNLDIRFYAYIMRKAGEMLEAQKPRTPHYTILRYIVEGNEVSVEHPECPKCCENGLVLWDAEIERGAAYCKRCGQAVRWE